MWTRYAPPSLDWDFREATFYRVVTTWYCTETVANVYNCFVQLEGDPFSKEKVNELFRQAYDLYVEPIPSIDTVKSPLVKDSIFGETCWPLSVCEKYTFEGFRDASLAFAAYYVQHRVELMQTHFSPNVTTLEKSHVGKKLFYLHKNDRDAPLIVEALQHVAHCFMTKMFVLYGTIVLQKFNNGFGFRDDYRSASPVYMPRYSTVHRYDAKRPADCFVASGTCEMRKKTKTGLEGDEVKRFLAVRCAKKISKVSGKRAGDLWRRPIGDNAKEVPSEATPGSSPGVNRRLLKVTPIQKNDTAPSPEESDEETCLDTMSQRPEDAVGNHEDVGKNHRSTATKERKVVSGDMAVEEEDSKLLSGVADGDEALQEAELLFQGLSQDSFQRNIGSQELSVRNGRQVLQRMYYDVSKTMNFSLQPWHVC